MNTISTKEKTFDNKPEQTNRTVYFDYLRVFATFAVMVIHISAQNWYSTDVRSFEWQSFNFFDSITRWAVPVFIMISGALFLGRDIPVKKIYSKYILRLLTAFITWSAMYALYTGGSAKEIIKLTVKGYYHMWFVPMIIGIYMCIPLLKPIIKDKRRTQYYLLLVLIFAFAVPEIQTLINDFGNQTLIGGAILFRDSVNSLKLNMVLGYGGYFVLGYYMSDLNQSKKQRTMIYILGIFGFVFTIAANSFVALKTNTPCANYFENISINVLFEALAVFTWFKHRNFNKSLNSIIQKLSKYSFGAYLAHVLIIGLLRNLGLNTLTINIFKPLSGMAVISVTVFVASFAISALLNNIPIVKKYIV